MNWDCAKQKQPKYSEVGELTSKILSEEYCSATNRIWILTHATTWTNIKNIMLSSEIHQILKGHIVLFHWYE